MVPQDAPASPEPPHSHSDLPGPQQVHEIQRSWLLAAVVDVVAERGAGSLTVAQVAGRAGVPRRTFYKLFRDCEECLLSAMDEAVAQIAAIIVPAFEAPASWRERMRAALAALLHLFDHDRVTARLCVVDSLAAGPRILERRMQVMASIIAAIEEGQEHPIADCNAPSLAAEGIVGAVLHLIHNRLIERSTEALRSLINPMMSMIVLPYLGENAAREELRMPASKADPQPAMLSASSRFETFEGLKMRLTYRTLRVLRAIEATPGASNREVADASGVRDPGQISKLLSRLSGLGLIRKGTGPVGAGAPNMWRLTDRGERLMRSIGGLGSP